MQIIEFVRQEFQAAIYGLFGVLKEAFWVSPPHALHSADNKIAQLTLAEELGLTISTLVTNDPESVREFFELCDGEMIVNTFRGWSGSFSG